MNNVVVADVMNRSPTTVSPDSKILYCAKLMVKKKLRLVLIVNKEKKLVGIISKKDLLWAIVKKSCKNLEEVKVIDISPKKIAKTTPMRTIPEVIDKMKNLGFDQLPVIEYGGRLVGLISIRDIFDFHPEFSPELEELKKISQEKENLKKAKTQEIISDGICEDCGNREVLFKFNGMLLCGSCLEIKH